MARPHFRAQRFQRKPGKKVWISNDISTIVLAASTDILIGTLNAAALALRPFTIMRTRLEILYTSDQTGASEAPVGELGMGVVSEAAAAVGITGLPKPFADTDFDWFVWQGLLTEFTFITGTGIQSNAGTHYVVDSKSMRKVGIADNIAIVVTQDNAVGSAITIRGRQLLLLH